MPKTKKGNFFNYLLRMIWGVFKLLPTFPGRTLKMHAALIPLLLLISSAISISITDLTELENGILLDIQEVVEKESFYYTTLSEFSGMIRITVDNTGTNSLRAELQECFLPSQVFFNFGENPRESCDLAPDESCEFVISVCDFDPSSRFFVSVSPATEGEQISYNLNAVETDLNDDISIVVDDFSGTFSIDPTINRDYHLHMINITDLEALDVVIISESDDAFNAFISKVPSDLECSTIHYRFEKYQSFRLAESCDEGAIFYLGISLNTTTSLTPQSYSIHARGTDDIDTEYLRYDISTKVFNSDNLNTKYWELYTEHKPDIITEVSLSHTHSSTEASSRLGVQNHTVSNSFCGDELTCSITDAESCRVTFEPCQRQRAHTLYASVTPYSESLSSVPLRLEVSNNQYEVNSVALDEIFKKDKVSEWTFIELTSEFDSWTSDIIDIYFSHSNAETIEVIVSRGGISKGGLCVDETFFCEENSENCSLSFPICKLDYPSGQLYFNIRSHPISATFNISISEKKPTSIELNQTIEDTILKYESYIYNITEFDSNTAGVAYLELVNTDSSNDELIMSIVKVNESSCPIHSLCRVSEPGDSCRLPINCLGGDQQPHIKIESTTNTQLRDSFEYKLKLIPLVSHLVENPGNFSIDQEMWFYSSVEYHTNLRFMVKPSGGAASLSLYRNCTLLRHGIDCEEDDTCYLGVNRSDEALEGTFWLRVSTMSPIDVEISVDTGSGICQNITTTFCGELNGVDVTNISTDDQDDLAAKTFETLSLTLADTSCPGIKDYVCGFYFPMCGEGGVAPAICKETCKVAFENCEVNQYSQCPIEFCESLPNCPIPPQPYRFYSGYIALLVIYGLLVVGFIFLIIVYLIKR